MSRIRMSLVVLALLGSAAPVAPVAPVATAAPAPSGGPSPLTMLIGVAGTYPEECLRPAPFALLPGLVAGVADGRVAIASPTGGRAMTVAGRLSPEQSSVGWSADGRSLATGDGRLWTRDGRSAGRLFGRLTGPWTWSPTAACAVGITGDPTAIATVLSVAARGQHSHPLLRGPIADFTFTPDGRALIVVGQLDTAPELTADFWRFDLATGQLTELARLGSGTCCVNLGGFAPGGRLLWFWGAPGGSVKADGWTLSGLDVVNGGKPVFYGVAGHSTVTLPRADFVIDCGSRTLAVVGASRNTTRVFDKRLAFVAPGSLPRYLTPSRAVHESPACSPDARFIAAPRGSNGGRFDRLRLALLTSTGTFVRYLDAGGAFGDYLPEWGTQGILFERLPDNATTVQLWFIPTGGAARATPLRADGPPETWDWSVTPPTGRATF